MGIEHLDWENQGVEPSGTLKTNGYQPNDKPAAGNFNWIYNTIDTATKALDVSATQSKEDIANLSDELLKVSGRVKGNIALYQNFEMSNLTFDSLLNCETDNLKRFLFSNYVLSPDGNDPIEITNLTDVKDIVRNKTTFYNDSPILLIDGNTIKAGYKDIASTEFVSNWTFTQTGLKYVETTYDGKYVYIYEATDGKVYFGIREQVTNTVVLADQFLGDSSLIEYIIPYRNEARETKPANYYIENTFRPIKIDSNDNVYLYRLANDPNGVYVQKFNADNNYSFDYSFNLPILDQVFSPRNFELINDRYLTIYSQTKQNVLDVGEETPVFSQVDLPEQILTTEEPRQMIIDANNGDIYKIYETQGMEKLNSDLENPKLAILNQVKHFGTFIDYDSKVIFQLVGGVSDSSANSITWWFQS